MRDAKPEIERRGAVLRIVGTGEPRWAKIFAEELGLEGSVFTDPERILYDALNLKRGVSRTLSVRSLPHLMRAFSEGHRQTRTRGDRWQQGGAIVVGTDGDIRYAYRSRISGDHAPLDDVLAAIP